MADCRARRNTITSRSAQDRGWEKPGRSLQLLNARDRHQQDPIDGRASQLQYSKGFDRLGTQLTFTGWRYSHQRYATLSEAFSSPGSDDDLQDSDNKKATLQITASQSLPYDITLSESRPDSYWSGGATQRTANMGISSQFTVSRGRSATATPAAATVTRRMTSRIPTKW